jgi:hypothetical protein
LIMEISPTDWRMSSFRKNGRRRDGRRASIS